MKGKRASGILLHITSLPGPYGIGDFGDEAYSFVKMLHETDQKVWQILPLTPTENCSPYSGTSAFAGHPLLISLDKLVEMNLLSRDDFDELSSFQFDDRYVKFNQVTKFKTLMLKKAFKNFQERKHRFKESLEEFIQSENYWLDDYALYMTIKELQNNPIWSQWPHGLKYHETEALNEIREGQRDLYEYYIFTQYIFQQQWSELKIFANSYGVTIIGDMPVYVDYGSSDVWANTHLFQLDKDTLLPSVVSGFPPDDCSAEGQNWNMPIYDWNNESKKPQVFNWWIKRLKKALHILDIVRIDHFRGLESYWSIPVDENFVPMKPIDGEWVKAAGVEFFHALISALGKDLPLIVEDLGSLTTETFDLRDQFNLTGIRIVQFGFGFYPDNMYRPHNYIQNSVAYTGTHDNPTAIGWWTKHAEHYEKKTFVTYIRSPEQLDECCNEDDRDNGMIHFLNGQIHWYLIKMVMGSVANIAIVQLQDLLGLDDEARMNDPSLSSDASSDSQQNWTWRYQWPMIQDHMKYKLKLYTRMFYRAGEIKK
ncbi:unnamed protein product [Rotaria sordida]|uniref:4-alpha-glucanotransferase n=1 Tax=Rotaria sordida TaxID=392033 RepID=A0A814ATU0_9BILA|nr:unnamed protein product [Rotaria sordida]CAF3743298.1 unnamed protein product [Rotaria sordida]